MGHCWELQDLGVQDVDDSGNHSGKFLDRRSKVSAYSSFYLFIFSLCSLQWH